MDNIYAKKVMTFKSGKFVFSRNFSVRELQPLRIEAQILYETVRDLPILPDLATNMEQDLIRRSIFGTAAIEGNPLTEERVGQIISDTNDTHTKERAEQEIRNLKNVYNLIGSLETMEGPPLLQEDLVRQIHETITFNIEDEYNIPGNYRNHLVNVGNRQHGGVYTPPKNLKDIKTLMKAFIEWINSDEVLALDRPIRAALSHYYLGLIHPFGDGNGRTARFIEALLLQTGGIKYVPAMLSNFYYRNIDDYFWAFSNSFKSKNSSVTPFLKFVLTGFVESLKEVKGRITYLIRKFTLRDYYDFLKKNKHITQRQFDLLTILLDYERSFTLNDLLSEAPFRVLYRKVTDRTARRDLKKLNGWLLERAEDNKYHLDLKALEHKKA
jgi:Fic family protein